MNHFLVSSETATYNPSRAALLHNLSWKVSTAPSTQTVLIQQCSLKDKLYINMHFKNFTKKMIRRKFYKVVLSHLSFSCTDDTNWNHARFLTKRQMTLTQLVCIIPADSKVPSHYFWNSNKTFWTKLCNCVWTKQCLNKTVQNSAVILPFSAACVL